MSSRPPRRSSYALPIWKARRQIIEPERQYQITLGDTGWRITNGLGQELASGLPTNKAALAWVEKKARATRQRET